MTGDRNDKLSELMRAIRWAEDCLKPCVRIKGSEKRRLRRKRRHDAKREIAP